MLAKRAELRPLPSLRRMVSAGEPLNPEVIAAFREATGLEIADGYGQTETGHLTGNLVGDAGPRRARWASRCPGFETADRRRRAAAASAPAARPSSAGYLDGEPFEGEWWPTGDLVREDDDGYLWYEGRDDDLILSAGYRIGPFEVESALLSHPAVAEAAAVAAPDPERGSVVRAIVVLRDARAAATSSPASCRSTASAMTAPYKFPRIVEFADELPKTASGKIKRAELRRALSELEAGPAG